MPRTVNYFIAQHYADVFRREPKNIGVVVELDGQVAARFAGEGSGGSVDRRKIRALEQPGVYVQWVKYWRRALTEPDALATIKRTAVGHYRVIDGGTVDSIGNDTIDDVANYLFAMLVSEGGLSEALGAPTDDDVRVRLSDTVGLALTDVHILGDSGLGVPYPVRRGVTVAGKVAEHTPAFIQQNHALTVMETVDFTNAKKELAKDHAGWAAFMFTDIKANSIAIIRATEKDMAHRQVQYALKLLEKSASDVVNWAVDEDRDRFVRERVKTATTT